MADGRIRFRQPGKPVGAVLDPSFFFSQSTRSQFAELEGVD
jgi:hypothetical protein